MAVDVQTVDDLLVVEETEHLWEYHIGEVYLWPALREDIMAKINARLRDYPSRNLPRASQVIRPGLWGKHLSTLSTFARRPSKPDSATLFVVWSKDHIYRPIYEQTDHPLILESSWFGESDSGNWGNDAYHMLLHDTLKVMEAGITPFRRLTAAEKSVISGFVEIVVNAFQLLQQRDRYQKMVVDHVMRYRISRPIVLDRIVPRLRTSTAFVAIAAYMARRAALVQLLHEGDIAVIEAQHGIVYPWHVAYNYPPSILRNRDHPARRYLPDVMLMFGEYWANEVRMPSEKRVIGFPKIALKQQEMSGTSADEYQILIVSQWTVTDTLIPIALDLAKALPDYRLIYKLHPIESTTPERFYALRDIRNIEIAADGDIHALIASSAIVVGINSTVLFEALAFPDKRVFYLDNDIISPSVGQAFTTVDELVAYIREGTKGKRVQATSYYWTDNPDDRMRQFLTEYKIP